MSTYDMVKRNRYLERLISFKDKELIKVVTGVRRSGKSTLFEQFKSYLIDNGVDQRQIISLNFEDLAYEDLKDYKKLYQYLLSRLNKEKMTYIFLDEVQEVVEFQRVVDSLYIQENTDLYITGSNANMLSGDLATLLSGRYIEIEVLPLSFKEFYELNGGDRQTAWQAYFNQGGFPYLNRIPDEEGQADYLNSIYSTVLLKDIVARHGFKDILVLESVIKFLFSSVGNIISPKKIADTLVSQGRKTTSKTIERYIYALTSSFILYKAGRYDLKGKQHLKTLEKYYIVDPAMRKILLQNPMSDYGHILENIIYLELRRRGYQVSIGKIDDLEVDFVATRGQERHYVQVTATMLDPKTYVREMKPLRVINDNFPKKVITLDTMVSNEDGIEVLNAIDFLLDEE